MTANNTRQIRAVIFDCDGVIIDSAQDIADALNAALAHFSMRTLSTALLRSYVGNGAAVLLERALKTSCSEHDDPSAAMEGVPLPCSESEFEEMLAWYKEYYFSHAVVKTTLYPGIADALSALKRAGVKTAIVTNKPTKILVEILKTLGVAAHFDALIGAEQVKELKPNPEGIFAALAAVNAGLAQKAHDSGEAAQAITPAEAVMVGDSYTDIAAGHAANTLTAAVLKGIGDVDKMLAQKPDLQLGLAAEIAQAVILANKIIEISHQH